MNTPEDIKVITKVIAYIDGFNLYHGITDKRLDPGLDDCRWLDLRKLCELILKPGEVLYEAKYFTAVNKSDVKGAERHKDYIQALEEYCGIETIEGFFQTKKARVNIEKIKLLGFTFRLFGWINKTVRFYMRKKEEKGSDVNLATELLYDACQNRFDVAIIVSGDGDFINVIKKIRHNLKKEVRLVFPPKREGTEKLKEAANSNRNLSVQQIQESRLPEKIKISPNVFLKAPEGWLPEEK